MCRLGDKSLRGRRHRAKVPQIQISSDFPGNKFVFAFLYGHETRNFEQGHDEVLLEVVSADLSRLVAV
jgi:hypothetical protein